MSFNQLSEPIPFIPFKSYWEIQPKTSTFHTSLFCVRLKNNHSKTVSVFSDHNDIYGHLYNYPDKTPYWEVYNGFYYNRVKLSNVKGLIDMIDDMLSNDEPQ